MDPNTTVKDAFTQAYEDTISNFKGAFAPPDTTTEQLYEELMGTYKPENQFGILRACLLYTSPSPRDGLLSRMPSSA